MRSNERFRLVSLVGIPFMARDSDSALQNDPRQAKQKSVRQGEADETLKSSTSFPTFVH